jgi:vancomycin permeability regulator SanA
VLIKKTKNSIKKIIYFTRERYITISLTLITVTIFWLIFSTIYVYRFGQKRIYENLNDVKDEQVAIVMGAGVTPDYKPSDVLRDRLELAADLYNDGKVEKILVSGDNRWHNYNEPLVMREVLIKEHNVQPEDVVADYAGRRTYDTCRRANEIWELEHAIVITQGFHLPRTIFTCNQLGVEGSGISATEQEYLGMSYFKIREFFAIQKMYIDLYLFEPSYVGGDNEEPLL